MAVSNDKPTCGAKTRSGGQCQLPAGHGGPTPGFGPCRVHGAYLPGPRKSAARKAGLSLARDLIGAEVEIDPLDSLLQTVRISAGMTAYHRARLRELTEAGKDTADEVALLGDAVSRQARIAKLATDAGVADRLVRIAERAGEMIALAFEDELAAVLAELDVVLSPAQRSRFAARLQGRLVALEDVPIEGTASDAPFG